MRPFPLLFLHALLSSTAAAGASITILISGEEKRLSSFAEIDSAVAQHNLSEGMGCSVLTDDNSRSRCVRALLAAELQKAHIRDALWTRDTSIERRLAASRSHEMLFRSVALESKEAARAAVSLLRDAGDTVMANLTRAHILHHARRGGVSERREDRKVDAAEFGEEAICAVTVATSLRPQVARLEASLKANGMNLTILGLNRTWQGHGLKIGLLHEYVNRRDVLLQCHGGLLFLDAYDTLATKWPEGTTLLKRFQALRAGIVFNGEQECTPDPALEDSTWPRHLLSHPLPFLNSGAFIGNVISIRRMLQEVVLDVQDNFGGHMESTDDQRLFTRWWLKNPGLASVDSNGLIFISLHEKDEAIADSSLALAVLEGQPGVVWSARTGTAPLLIHGNGNGCLRFMRIVRDLESRHRWPSTNGDSSITYQYPPQPFATDEWKFCSWPWNSGY